MSKAKRGNRNVKNHPEAPDFWGKLKGWQIHVICLSFLLIAPALLHAPSILGGQVLTTNDIIQWRAGAESLMQHKAETGEHAQWSTNMFGGMPAYVISNLERFPSFDTIILPIFKFVFPLIEYWILLLGAYFFLLKMGYRPLVSVIGSLIIGLTTYIPIIVGAGHNTKFLAYAFIPWVFAGYKMMSDQCKELTKEGVAFAGFLIFTVAFMLHVRSGHPQVTYYFLWLMAIWWIFDGIDSFKAGLQKNWLKFTGFLLAGGLLAALSVIEQYWALMEYSSASIRGGSDIGGNSGLAQDYAFVWSQGWGELLTLIIPGLYGGSELYWGPKPFTSGPHYFGSLGFVLVLFGVIFNRTRYTRIFVLTGVLAILFSLGKHFGILNNLMFDYFPLFNKFRTPEMWLMLAIFSFIIPAMDGLSWFVDKTEEVIGSGKKWLIIAGLSVLPALIVIGLSDSVFSFEKEGERSRIAEQVASSNQVSPQDPRVTQAVDRIIAEQILPERISLARSDAFRMVVIAGMAIALLWFSVHGKLAISITLMLLSVITMFDMVSIGRKYVPEYAYQPSGFDAVTVIESRKRSTDTWMQNAIQTDEPWSYRVFPLADNPFNNAIPSFFYPSIGGYSGAKLGVFQDVIDEALFTGPTGININILSILNVKYMTYGARIPGFSVAYQADGVLVLENDEVLPKAFFVDSVIRADGPAEAMALLQDMDVNFHNTAIVMDEGIRSSHDSTATVVVTRYDAHQIDLEVYREQEGFLVLSEMYYPNGWKAWLGETEIPIYRTNYMLRGLQIPSGSHVITMRYEPDWYKPVRFISTAANFVILVIGIGGVVLFVRQKRRLKESI